VQCPQLANNAPGAGLSYLPIASHPNLFGHYLSLNHVPHSTSPPDKVFWLPWLFPTRPTASKVDGMPTTSSLGRGIEKKKPNRIHISGRHHSLESHSHLVHPCLQGVAVVHDATAPPSPQHLCMVNLVPRFTRTAEIFVNLLTYSVSESI